MNKIITLIISILIAESSFAQYAYFSTRGAISYDKVTFTRARMRDMQQQMSQNTQGRFGGGRMFDLENIPESTTEKYTFQFDENSTLMFTDPDAQPENQPKGQGMQSQRIEIRGGNRGGQGRGGSVSGNFQAQGITRMQGGRNTRPDNSSKVLAQNLKNATSEVQVQIDDKYLITDSLSEITWRFSDEYRNIAGYECRRVNGATKDSLYVIAFYTDEIPISAGPALTHGLPGMILGLVIPEMHIQYWATKVNISNELVKKDWKDKKATSIKLDEFVNAFGRYFQRGGDRNSNKRQVQEQLIY